MLHKNKKVSLAGYGKRDASYVNIAAYLMNNVIGRRTEVGEYSEALNVVDKFSRKEGVKHIHDFPGLKEQIVIFLYDIGFNINTDFPEEEVSKILRIYIEEETPKPKKPRTKKGESSAPVIEPIEQLTIFPPKPVWEEETLEPADKGFLQGLRIACSEKEALKKFAEYIAKKT